MEQIIRKHPPPPTPLKTPKKEMSNIQIEQMAEAYITQSITFMIQIHERQNIHI